MLKVQRSKSRFGVSVLSLSFAFKLFLLAAYADDLNSADKCVVMPTPPMHGRYVIKGGFQLRLLCPDENKDLPANTPGGGVLFCIPGETNRELGKVIAPECLERKIPKSVFIPIIVGYIKPDIKCSSKEMNTIAQTAISVMKNSVASLNLHCYSEKECFKTTNHTTCGEGNTGLRIDVNFKFVILYNEKAPLAYYTSLRSKIEAMKNTGDKGLWYIKGTKIRFIWYGPLTSTCDDKSTIGSQLVLHHTASCRGCPRSWYKDPGVERCLQCPFGYYTRNAYSNGHDKCVLCPDSSLWGKHRPEMLQLCYGRV